MKKLFARNRERRTAPVRVEPSLQMSKKERLNLGSFKCGDGVSIPRSMEEVLRPYEPPKGIVGSGTSMAQDSGLAGSMSSLAGFAGGYPEIAAGYFADGLAFLGYPQLAQMAQRAEFRKPCQVIARECTREWIEFGSAKQGNDEKENDAAAEKIKQIEAEFIRLDVRRIVQRHIYHGLTYGLGHIWIGIKGAAIDSSAQAQPLVIGPNGMSKGSLERLENVEPIWTTPNKYNADNPLRADYYRASSWWVLGVEVHRSRLLTTVPFPVSQMLAPAFNFGGQSLTQMLQAYVHNYLGTRNSTANIVRNFSKIVLKTDMTGNMQADMPGQPMPYGDVDMQSVQGRAAFMQDTADGQSAIVVDKEREDAAIIATPLGGLDALQAQSMKAMASIPGIPLVKLFGIQPTGLNASSEGEIRVFYDEISSFQEENVRPVIQTIFEAVQINLWGKIDPDLSFEFIQLWQMDEKQLAEIEKLKADQDAVLVQAGIVSPEEARERQATDPQSNYRNVNLTGIAPEPPDPEVDGEGLEGVLKHGEEEE
ncbi:DUF1073 domain-containing protein [Acetobacter sp. UBA5411]|uniref:phage portal protein n=1 Tax=Acetobacter sp. UBA5411 TaxID=1945905 RepID=UPI0025C57536|nr:DUF1073 domain-containing protein [Acetobacter sp. UBA5411]